MERICDLMEKEQEQNFYLLALDLVYELCETLEQEEYEEFRNYLIRKRGFQKYFKEYNLY